MKKKVLAALLSACMVLGVSACGSETADSSVTTGSEAQAVTESAESTASNDASNGTEEAAIDTSEYVELKMYLVGDKPEGFDDVYEKVNEILLDKINATVSVDWLSWAEHGTKYSLLFSGNEDFDMIFTATSWCHFEQTVGLGGFKALDEDFIKTYAPDIWEMEPELAWQQATIDGNIYMVPANYIEVTPNTLAIRGDLMEQYGFDDIDSWDSLMEFYGKCGDGGIYANGSGAEGLYWVWFQKDGYNILSGAPDDGQLVLYHTADPSDLTTRYILDDEGFTEYCRLMKELADKGSWPTDVLNSTADRQDGLVNGTGASMIWNLGSCQTYANQANAEHPEWNINVYNVMPDVPYTSTKYINGGIGININSANPERAMMALNLFATNKEIHELTQLGIEGVNWESVGDDQYKVIEGNEYNASNFWGWRNQDLMRKKYNENPTAVDTKTAELEEYYLSHVKTQNHILEGFAFDSSHVSTEYAAVEAVMSTYFDPLINGLVGDVDATLDEFRKAMDAAGVQTVLTELQSQIDTYIAENQ